MSPPSLRALGWLVVRDVNRTVGGGMAAMELMRRSLARRGWLDDGEHGVLVAVSRFTPGTNVLAYCAALGWTHQRVRRRPRRRSWPRRCPARPSSPP